MLTSSLWALATDLLILWYSCTCSPSLLIPILQITESESSKYYPDMACNNSYHPVLPEATCNQMRASWPNCERLISNCYKWESPFVCVPATIYCEKAMFGPYQETGLNPYDVRVKCGSNPLCYDILGWMESYLNNPAIQKELGVIPAKKFAGCNMDINKKFLMAGDWMRGRYVHELPRLLKNGIKILIYAGDAGLLLSLHFYFLPKLTLRLNPRLHLQLDRQQAMGPEPGL